MPALIDDGVGRIISLFLILAVCLPAFAYGLFSLFKWAKKRSAGAYLMLAVLPLISLFPMPPSELESIVEAKQEQPEEEDESGDPPNEEDCIDAGGH